MAYLRPRLKSVPEDLIAGTDGRALTPAASSVKAFAFRVNAESSLKLASRPPGEPRRLARHRYLRHQEALIRQELRRLAHGAGLR
jgi:hypothetical protein